MSIAVRENVTMSNGAGAFRSGTTYMRHLEILICGNRILRCHIAMRMQVSGYLKPVFFEIFLLASVRDDKTIRIYLCKTIPVLTCTLKIESSGTGTFQLRRAPIRLIGSQNHE